MELNLDYSKKNIALRAFGLTREECQLGPYQTCINCRIRIDTSNWKEIDVKEYNISALCPKCFDIITKPAPRPNCP